MPEYLAPGVYVEETSFRAKSIEGVGTSTTAFVGPTRRGPTTGTPEMITSLPDFERIYGSLENLVLSDVSAAADSLNFVAHAARAYYDNGGSRLYVVRTVNSAATALARLRDGAGTATEDVNIRARLAGAAYNGVLRMRETARSATVLTMGTAPNGSMLRLTVPDTNPANPPVVTLYLKASGAWANSSAGALSLTGLGPGATPGGTGASAELLSLSVEFADADG